MALEIGIVGPSGGGKTALFTALTKTGGGEYGKTNVGMAPIADERLGALAEVVHARKVTPAAIRVQDVPGAGEAQLGNLRQVDALLVVLRGFGGGADVLGAVLITSANAIPNEGSGSLAGTVSLTLTMQVFTAPENAAAATGTAKTPAASKTK